MPEISVDELLRQLDDSSIQIANICHIIWPIRSTDFGVIPAPNRCDNCTFSGILFVSIYHPQYRGRHFNANRSLECNDSIRYAEGIVVNVTNTSESEWVRELFNCNLAFVKRLREISMDTTEFSILNAIVLTYPGKLHGQKSMKSVRANYVPYAQMPTSPLCSIVNTFRESLASLSIAVAFLR